MRLVCLLTSEGYQRASHVACFDIRHGEEAAELEDDNVDLMLDQVTSDNIVIDALFVRRPDARRLVQE